MFWTDEKALEFVKTEFPEELENYKAYQYNIQRVDALRYYLLVHYGGIYLDLDVGCNRRLDFLLSYTSAIPSTEPTGVSNNILISAPGNPFFKYVISTLSKNNFWRVLPYITVMYSTGPMFLSLNFVDYFMKSLEEFKDKNVQGGGVFLSDVHLLPQETYSDTGNYQYTKEQVPFFRHVTGDSWETIDHKILSVLINIISNPFLLAAVIVMILVAFFYFKRNGKPKLASVGSNSYSAQYT